MADDSKLEKILGRDRLKDLTVNNDDNTFLNATEIYCKCKTLILKPKHAKLTETTEQMSNLEKDLAFLQTDEEHFKSLVRGCYWLVDDMYKFEQIGYTRTLDQNSTTPQTIAERQKADGLRYLACAECNLCPLGWYDPTTKESYLYVW